MIAIIDYKLGNVTSVINSLNKLGIKNICTDDPEKIKTSSGIILPGVGAAKTGMDNLKKNGLDQLLSTELKSGKPFLGICLGMQLLFEFSEEDNVKCLGILPGQVKKFDHKLKIPQIGWNRVTENKQSQLFKGIPDNTFFYFVNSYYCRPENLQIVTGTTGYGIEFASVVENGSIFGTQFHPEKSGENGLKILQNFAEVCK